MSDFKPERIVIGLIQRDPEIEEQLARGHFNGEQLSQLVLVAVSWAEQAHTQLDLRLARPAGTTIDRLAQAIYDGTYEMMIKTNHMFDDNE